MPLVPGDKSYRDALTNEQSGNTCYSQEEREEKIGNIKKGREKRESKTLVFASSITRDIDKRAFSDNCRYGNVTFHEFRGKKAKDIVRYMEHHLEEENPHTVVLVAGGNDLPSKDMTLREIEKVAEHLIEGGAKCKRTFGATDRKSVV